MASTTVARTHPDVEAPVTITVSQWADASIGASGVPKKADANSFRSTGSPGAGAIRSSILGQGGPGARGSSDGPLSVDAFAPRRPLSSYSIVVKAIGQ